MIIGEEIFLFSFGSFSVSGLDLHVYVESLFLIGMIVGDVDVERSMLLFLSSTTVNR